MSPVSFSMERRIVPVPQRLDDCGMCREPSVIRFEMLTFAGSRQMGDAVPLCAGCKKEAEGK